MIVFLCIYFFLATRLFIGVDSLGVWGTLTDKELAADSYAAYYKWRGPDSRRELDNTTLMFNSFTSQSPCRALTVHDNCFSHNPNRADILLRRVYERNFKSVKDTPFQLLSNLQNKMIVFAGDSTVASVYASVVCHLSQFSNASYRLKWVYERETLLNDEDKQDKCPSDPSCNLIGGDSHFARHNVTFRYIQFHSYHGRGKSSLQPLIDGHMRPAVVVINFGSHYSDEEQYSRDLLSFRQDGAKLQSQQGSESTSQWLWLESVPRHYVSTNTSSAADASRTAQSHFNLLCEPIKDKALFHQTDWRNRLVDKMLPEFQRSGRLVRIAEPLYDQWDAHVDNGDSFRAEARMDCTHYCVGSGVFRFLIEEVLSAMQNVTEGLRQGQGQTFNIADLPVAKPTIKKHVLCSTASAKSPVKAGTSGRAAVGSRAQQKQQARGKKEQKCV